MIENYNPGQTYGFYYGDMSVDRVMYHIERITGQSDKVELDRYHYNEGVVLTGVGDSNGWDEDRNIMLYVSRGKFYDGHLQQHCHDIVTVDLTILCCVKPLTVCQVHDFGGM